MHPELSMSKLSNPQHTLARAVAFSGRGLHTGKIAHVTLQPAPANHGIVFRKCAADGKELARIPALWHRVHDMPLCTCIAQDQWFIRTVEHLLAALYAFNIDNALIDVVGDEIPIFDGSSRVFVEYVQQAGTVAQDQARRQIRILKPMEYAEGDKRVAIEPAAQFSVDVTISLSKIGRLNWQGVVTPQVIVQELAYARTFGRLMPGLVAKAASYFRKVPVGLGAHPGSVILLWGKHGITQGGLRAPDEYVRHRVIDLIGDMCLAGHPLQAKVTTHSTAHRLNHRLLDKVFADDTAWCWA